MEHPELVDKARRWLKSIGCHTVITEMVSYTPYGEEPDAIGWVQGFSVLVECKVSRSDFLTDHKKQFRRNPEWGMGNHRLYLCPEGLIKPDELPADWGLLYAVGGRKKVEPVIAPRGNCSWGSGPFYNRTSDKSEIRLLLSLIRRHKIEQKKK